MEKNTAHVGSECKVGYGSKDHISFCRFKSYFWVILLGQIQTFNSCNITCVLFIMKQSKLEFKGRDMFQFKSSIPCFFVSLYTSPIIICHVVDFFHFDYFMKKVK